MATAALEIPNARLLQRLGALLAMAALAEAVGIATLGTRGDPRFELRANLVTVGFLGTITLYPFVGSLIVQRRPYTRVAWLMILLGLGLGLGLLTAAYGVVGYSRSWSFALESLVLSQLLFIPSLGLATTLILLLFPTDHLLGRRWRVVVLISLVGLAIYEVAVFVRPGEWDPSTLPGVQNPFGLPSEFADLVAFANVASSALLAVGFSLATASVVVRYRRAGTVEAAQIRWVAFVALIALPVIAISPLPLGRLSQFLSELGTVLLACMPIAIGVAITRYRLYDIDRLINRTLVYGSLTAILAGVFAAAAAVSQRIFLIVTGEKSDAAIVATTLIVATLYTPLRKWLDTIVDRRFKYEQSRYGSYRDELNKTLSLVDARSAAERLAGEITRETGVADLAVVDSAGEPTARRGRWPIPDPITIDIPNGHGQLSSVVVSPMVGRRALDDRRRAEIEEIAGLAARTVRRSEGR